MKELQLTIHDHVNFELAGLRRKDIDFIRDNTGIFVKGCFTTAAYKAKIWDGRESLFDESGLGFIYELDKVLDNVERLGYDLDEDIDLIVEQEPFNPDIKEIDSSFLLEESGHHLRDYQVDCINAAINNRMGLFDVGTNGGKSWICVGISKVYDPFIKSVVIVPTEKLAKQTYADYAKTNLNAAVLTAKTKPADRKKFIQNARHIIITNKLFMNCVKEFANCQWVIMVDEIHTFGDVFADMLRFDMGHCPVRLGMSGSIPKVKADPFKRNKIMAHLGGGILRTVKQKELMERGISSAMKIEMVVTKHAEIEGVIDALGKDFDWSIEEDYNLSNSERIQAIADFIETRHKQDPKNTLILCHAGLGKLMSDYLGVGLIVDETKSEVRDDLFAKFDDMDDHMFCATFGTSGTGISSNRIFRLYLIDVGKNYTYIMQGIGRGLRRDGVVDEVEVVDVSSNNPFAKKHRRERLAIYREEHYEYTEGTSNIIV
jgi:superfamily II DNA or RNA helicase